ncbi:MAG TPA: hypothetical protein VMZ31_08950 [Phycisphaerae bacterium]|nr:hypothetical protein [Phycisphaerae bacterium]
MKRDGSHSGRVGMLLIAGTILLSWLTAAVAQSDHKAALAEGGRLFDEGKYADAASAYEADRQDDKQTDEPIPAVLRYNAGVSYLRDGKWDEAIERFEDASVRAQEPLRDAAIYNLAYARFEKGHQLAEGAAEQDGDDAKLKTLAEAAANYRGAIDFFRQLRPRDEQVTHNIGVAKTALRVVLDRIAQIEEQRRKQADEDALKAPAKLLFELMGNERLHRVLSRALREVPERSARIAARRLQRSQARLRGRTDMLARYLAEFEAQAAATAPATSQPGAADEQQVERYRAAGERLRQTIEAQHGAEAALDELDFASAGDSQTASIRGMRDALQLLPLELGMVLNDALAVTGENLARSEEKAGVKPQPRSDQAPTSQPASDVRRFLDVLGDKVLGKLGSMLTPADVAGAAPLAEAQEDVVWATRLLAAAEISVPDSPQQGTTDEVGSPGMDAETIEQIHALAETAAQAAQNAHTQLADGHVAASLDDQRATLEALEKIAELLPKPPKSPAERLRQLIERERVVRQAIDGLAEMDDGQDEALAMLADSQNEDAAEAADMAGQLSNSQDENHQAAAGKTREGAQSASTSSEALGQQRLEAARRNTDQAIERLTEALALLSGQQQNDQQQQQDQKQNQQKDSSQQDQKDEQQDQSDQGYRLTPRQARLRMDEMDQKRREEEKAILQAPSSVTVSKDW